MPYKIPDWDVFQNYKDRRPPWIRFHRTLLDNRKFQSLPLSARAMLPMMWLLATETQDYMSGIVDLSDEDICFRLRVTQAELEKNIESLVSNCFIEVVRFDTDLYESVSQRQNTEAETKTETDPRKSGFILPPYINPDSWKHYLDFRKASKGAFTQHAAELALKKLAKLYSEEQNTTDVIEQTIERGYTGLFPVKADYSPKKKPGGLVV